MSEKTLEGMGFKVGDLVTYADNKESTGGVIFQIVEDTAPVKPAITQRKVMRNYNHYDPATSGYVVKQREVTEYGAWDEKGRKIMRAATFGFIRVKPLFDFFATSKGKSPKGKGTTLILYYAAVKRKLQKVDLVVLGTKYVELGNIMRDIVKAGVDGN